MVGTSHAAYEGVGGDVVGHHDRQLDEVCLASGLARFKRPREYRFVEALPKNNYGKVLKTALREVLKGEVRKRL